MTYAWVIWGIAAIFYGYEFIHRILPAAMLPELKLAFDASDAALGTLTAIYFWAYALFQIPAGILIDRYGSRILLTTASFIITIGSFMLVLSPNINIAFLSRFLVGFGSAFAFIGCLKLGRQWLSQSSFPLVVGFTSLCGQIAAVLGNHPLTLLVENLGWQPTVYLISVAGILITLMLGLIVRNNTHHHKNIIPSMREAFFYLSKIIKHKQSWLIAIYGCLVVSPIVAFSEFWGTHYLQSKCNLGRPDAAFLNSAVFIGIAIGGPLLGWLAKYCSNHLHIMRLCSLIASVCLITIINVNFLSYAMLMGLLFIYGMMSSNMLLCFTLINQEYQLIHQATAIGFINTIIMFGGAFFPIIIGFILDYLTNNTPNQYLVPTQIHDLEQALMILPAALLLSVCLTFFIKQKTITQD